MKIKTGYVVASGFLVGAAAVLIARAGSRDTLETVSHVDLERYLGHWYEIAKYPNRFEKKCAGNVTADYSLLSDGKVRVINSCAGHRGQVAASRGTAKIVDSATNAKLKVAFFWPFYGDYWILDLGSSSEPGGPYEYSVVGEPSRRYLWILSRSPQIPESLYQEILRRIAERGYDPSKLVRTPQSTAP